MKVVGEYIKLYNDLNPVSTETKKNK